MSCERADVRQIRVMRGVGPEIVVLRHERMHDVWIAGEIDRFVNVARVRRHRRIGSVREVRRAEMHLGLAGVEDHLPVIDAVA